MHLVFAYGSNMGSRGLAGKGVLAARSWPAVLPGHALTFDVPSVFRGLDGGVANVVPADDEVHGVVHAIDDAGLAKIDGLEGLGVLYDRVHVRVHGYDGQPCEAMIYAGVSAIRDPGLRPSVRYRDLLVAGAEQMGLVDAWVRRLRATPLHRPDPDEPFAAPQGAPRLDAAALAQRPTWIALGGVIFDLTHARAEQRVIPRLVGGGDLTPVVLAMARASADLSPADERARVEAMQRALARDYPIVGRLAEPG